jgi:hypothetical protein
MQALLRTCETYNTRRKTMQSGWMTHKGQTFMYCCYSNLSADDLKAELEWAETVVCQQPENSVLILQDHRNVIASPETLDIIRISPRISKYTRRYAMVRTADHRVTTYIQAKVMEIMILLLGKKLGIFDDFEKAKDWLVKAN